MVYAVAARPFRQLVWSNLRAVGLFPAVVSSGALPLFFAALVFARAEDELGRPQARVLALAVGAAVALFFWGLFLLSVWYGAKRCRLLLDGDVLTVWAGGRERFHLRYVEAVWVGTPPPAPTVLYRVATTASRFGFGHGGPLLQAGRQLEVKAAELTLMVVEKTGRKTKFPNALTVFDPAPLRAFLQTLEARGVTVVWDGATRLADDGTRASPDPPSSNLL